MDLKDLTPELLEKAKACKTREEFLTLLDSEGLELTDEQLDAVSAGWTWDCSEQGYVPEGGGSWGTP